MNPLYRGRAAADQFTHPQLFDEYLYDAGTSTVGVEGTPPE